MLSVIKTALAAVVVLGSVSLAPAPTFAANHAHRHSVYAHPGEYGLRAHSFHSRDVSLPRESMPSAAEEEWMDRASANVGGGGK